MPRVPTTIEEKKAAGSYRPGTHGHDESPPGVLGRPEVPEFLTPHQKKIFNHVCDMMSDAQWLRVSDGETIHAYAVMKSRLDLKPDEFTAAEFTQLRMLANELGLSPAARAKMPKVPPAAKKNEFDDL